MIRLLAGVAYVLVAWVALRLTRSAVQLARQNHEKGV